MKNLKLYGPFLWMGFNFLKATEALRGEGLLFIAKCPGVPGTHLINFDRMKGWNNLDLEETQQIWTWDPALRFQRLNQ